MRNLYLKSVAMLLVIQLCGCVNQQYTCDSSFGAGAKWCSDVIGDIAVKNTKCGNNQVADLGMDAKVRGDRKGRSHFNTVIDAQCVKQADTSP